MSTLSRPLSAPHVTDDAATAPADSDHLKPRRQHGDHETGLTNHWERAAQAVTAWFQTHRIALVSLLACVVWYTPSLRNGCTDAGYLFGGDVVGFSWPHVAKMQSLLSQHHFTALDFSQFNGSSDFFLAANFFPFHPFFVVWSLLTSPAEITVEAAGRCLAYMLALHSFLACYFTLRLLTRFGGLGFGPATIAAVGFAFGYPMICSHSQPMFHFCTAIVPWAAYGALNYGRSPDWRRLSLAILPVVVGYLAGYLPLGIACLGVAALIVGVEAFLVTNTHRTVSACVSRFACGLVPFFIGTLIVTPYLIAAYQFLRQSPSDSTASLFYSAHQLTEAPQSWLRLLSFRWIVPGPAYEFSLTWGFVPVAIVALFLGSDRPQNVASKQDWAIIKASAALYFLVALSIFGQYSAASDFVYYFVPQVGRMHIYQRFLLPAHLALMVMVAVMLKCVVDARITTQPRILCAGFLSASGLAAYAQGHFPLATQAAGINDFVVLELLLGGLAMAALLTPGRTFAYSAVLVLMMLPTLDIMYDFSVGGNTRAEKTPRLGVMLDPQLRSTVVKYARRFRDKGLIKYVDITPRYTKAGVETFAKAFPYFVLHDANLSSYGGFNFYLAARADYMRTMPVSGDVQFRPDWERLRNTGADFVVALEKDLPGISAFTGELGADDLLRLPNDVVLAPFSWAKKRPAVRSTTAFENGYVRVSRQGGTTQHVADPANIALGKPARQSSGPDGDAARAVDGITDGRFEAGSVTHTANEPGAWLEVDLGATHEIGSVRIWNRDECPERLQDFTISISDHPLAKDDPASISVNWQRPVKVTPRPAVTVDAENARGRYVRIQLAAPNANPESILSLAELEVFEPTALQTPILAHEPSGRDDNPVTGFSSNDANHIRIGINASSGVALQYLLWNNPLLQYRVDGKRVQPSERDGLPTINIGEGRHVVDITYRHPLVLSFWLIYAGYMTVLLAALLTYAVAVARRVCAAALAKS